MDRTASQNSLAEPEDRNDQDAVSSVEMNRKESIYVLELENRVAELEKQLCDIHMESEVKGKECEQKQQAHNILKEKCDKMEKEKKELLKDLERGRQGYSVLLSQSNDAKDTLENENIKLRDEVQALRGSVESLEEELSETRRMFEEKTAKNEEEQMIYRILKEKYDEMEKKIKEKEELINGHESKLKDQEDRKISLNNKLNEIIRESELKSKELERWRQENNVLLSQCNKAKATLENENMKLRDEIQNLQGSVQSLEEELSGTCRMYEEKMRSTLENENIKLREEVQTLLGSVENLKQELCETRRMCEEIMRDNEEKQMAHRILKEKYDEMEKEIKEKEELINDYESKLKEQEDKEISLNNKLHLFIREFEFKSEELERRQQEYSVLLSQYKNTEKY
ncbi:uncharacterized protein Hap1MRO34_006906 isoform 2-T2 [Clarias gariepinus]|uniref:trichohyalin-like isoform X2 n=1 Tax=Clarias gariepinus TaxID=13013 RepID=UPI00234CBBAD|nr:trichohyalin-like isoform X2 [Clarias gariepinus]